MSDEDIVFNQSIGAKRVRIEFNPSDSSAVYSIKKVTADLINGLQVDRNEIAANGYYLPQDIWREKHAEQLRLIEKAQEKYEEACMWAVKAITTQK